jgi:hypothetical protein
MCYAALVVAVSSGVESQTYDEKMGIGSARGPREMTMPMGSVEVGMIYGFFI